MPGAVEADEDLPQQALEAHRLAPQLEHVDRGIDHGGRRVGRRERGVDQPLGRLRTAVGADDVWVAGAAGQRGEHDVRPGPRAARDRTGAGRGQLDDPAGVAPRLGQPGPRHPVVGRHAAQHARDQRLRRITLEQQHDPRVAREHRPDRAQGAGDRRRLPAPRGPDRRAEQRLEGQGRGGVAAEDPGRPVVSPGQALAPRGARAACPAPAGPRGRIADPARCPASRPSASRAAGVPCLSTAVAEPSTRLRRSSPSRAGTGPQAPLSRRWTKPRTRRTPSSNAIHGLRSRHWAAPGRRTCPDAIRSAATRPGDVARRLAGASACSRASRRAARIGRRPQVALDPLQDRSQRRPAGAACGGRAARPAAPRRPRAPGTGRAVRPRISQPVLVERPRDVLRVERRLPLLPAAELVAADGAAVVLADRASDPQPRRRRPSALGHGPGQLVEDDRPIARGAPAREAVGDRCLEAGVAAGRGPQRLDRGVEVAEVGRPEHDLGQQPVERASISRLTALALVIDRGRARPSRPGRTGRARCRREPRPPRAVRRPAPGAAAARTARRPGG